MSGPAAGDEAPEAPLRLRRAGFTAGAAFLLLATALLLPWWVVSNQVGGLSTGLAAVYPFGASQAFVHPEAKLVTGLLVAAALALLFLRVASRAWAHEARVWRRDLAVSMLLVLLALASGMFWPLAEAQVPFWGGRTYLLDNGTGAQLTVAANPGLGWWLALLAGLLLAGAWWASRRTRTD